MFVNELIHGGIRAIIAYDPTVFDNLVLPDDLDNDDARQMIIDRIIYKYGDAPLFTPDPDVLKYYIGIWSLERSPLWERYAALEFTEYNPIENYDREEKTTDIFYPGSTYEQKISADNATTYQPDRQSVGSGKDKRDITGRIHGNIGVTTTQQMINQELEVLPKLDVINIIADDWHDEFCLKMYN